MAHPSDLVRALYDRAPYPPAGGGSGMTISTSWLDGAAHPHGPLLRDGARILFAGCGTGVEVAGFARALPATEVVGVDFSAASIAAGRDAMPSNARLVHADLTDPRLPDRLGRFELIVCHAVADYVPDSVALLRTLSMSLSPHGVAYLSLNTPHHPRQRLLHALGRLGLPPEPGPGVRVASALMGDHAGVADLAALPDALLAVDALAPFAHHRPLEQWAELARAAGLQTCGTPTTAIHLARVDDTDLPLLYPLSRGDLALLVQRMRFDGGSALLLAKHAPAEPPWADPEALARWAPTRDASLDGLPALGPGTHALTVRIPGWPDAVVRVSGEVLDVLRRADGRAPLAELGVHVGPAEIAGLFRCYQAWLVR